MIIIIDIRMLGCYIAKATLTGIYFVCVFFRLFS